MDRSADRRKAGRSRFWSVVGRRWPSAEALRRGLKPAPTLPCTCNQQALRAPMEHLVALEY